MTIRNESELAQIGKTIDLDKLRVELDTFLRKRMPYYRESTATKELEDAFAEADAVVCQKYGLSVWDALVLLRKDTPSAATEGFDDWRKIYDWLHELQTRAGLRANFSEDFDGTPTQCVLCPPENFDKWRELLCQQQPSVETEFLISLCAHENGKVLREFQCRLGARR